jgi:glycosyltransferase involved in cell wall biosynthesis
MTARHLRPLAIIPAYNEQACVAQVVEAIGRHAPEFDVLVVDDGSTDRTAAAAEAAGAIVLRHPFNLGIGGAVQSGFRYAQRHGYDVAVQIDGDGQHDPAYLPKLLAEFEADPSLDMLCGSRFREGPGYRVPVQRRLGMLVFSTVLSAMVRQKITDPTSGFRMTGRRGIELFARDYPHDYPEVEAILMIYANRLTMREYPMRMRVREGGRSSIAPAYYMFKVLLALFVGLFRARVSIEPGEAAPVAAQRGI